MTETDGMMGPDEFIGEVIGIFRLDSFSIDIHHDAEKTEQRVEVFVSATMPAGNFTAFDGFGPTMGHALQTCRAQIKEVTGR